MGKKKCGDLLFILLILVILAISLYPVSFLEVRMEREPQILLLKKVSPGEQFEFRYIHSVDKTPVFGFFLITPERTIKPVETHFLSYGPGLPSTEGEVAVEKGMIIAKPEVEEMKRFSFFVSPITHQSLIFKNERLDFSSMKEGEVIAAEVKRYPIGRIVLKYGRK